MRPKPKAFTMETESNSSGSSSDSAHSYDGAMSEDSGRSHSDSSGEYEKKTIMNMSNLLTLVMKSQAMFL